MKRTLIITLLFLVAAFSFSQTNATFNNLDVRGTSKLRGIPYPFGAVASNLNPTLHEVAVINNSTFALCRIDFQEFADSIANYLSPIIGTHWYTVAPDTIKTNYNVVVDSSFKMSYNGNYLGLFPDTTLYLFQIDMNTLKYSGITVANVPYQTINISSDDLMETEEARVLLSNDARPEVLINSTRTDSNSYMFIIPTQISLTNNTDGNLTKFIIEEDRFIMDELSNTAGTSLMMWDSVSKEVTRVQNVTVPGDLTITGNFIYEQPHAFLTYKVTGNDTIGGSSAGNLIAITTRWIWTKFALGFTDTETHTFTLIATDTLRYDGTLPGHIKFDIPITVDGGNGDDWEMAIFNVTDAANTPISTRQAWTTTGAGNKNSMTVSAYDTAADPGDKYVLKVRNLSGTGDLNVFYCDIFANLIHSE